MSVRVIPRLDIKGPNLVKGVHLEGLRVLGRPEWYATRYYQDGADELIYIDQVASLYGRNNLDEIVRRTAERLHIALTVAGGIRSLDDIQRLLRAGADKVAINTAAIKRPALIREAAQVFGSQCIVLYVEAKWRAPGRYECLTDNARERSGVDVFEWVQRAVDLGAGEILVTSVDREGTGKGYDVELVSRIVGLVSVPVIASGGAGRPEHVRDVVTQGRASAVCLASVVHYGLLEDMERESFQSEEGNTEFLRGKLPIESLRRRCVTPMRIREVKAALSEAGIPVRQRDGHSLEGEDAPDAGAFGTRITVADYGLGNLFSIRRTLEHLGVAVDITSDPEAVRHAQGLILPGVGAFGDGMRQLHERGLVEPLRELVRAGRPILGICLGMQLLFSESEEFGAHEGLGFIQGRVQRLSGRGVDGERVEVPNVGWNVLIRSPGLSSWDGTLLEGLAESESMYFVHSYVPRPVDPGVTLAWIHYGGQSYAGVVQRDNVMGCQGHPEKSGATGMRILRNFVHRVAATQKEYVG